MKPPEVAELVEKLSGLFRGREQTDAAQRTAAFWWGAQDEEVGWWLGLSKMVNSAIAQSMYIAHVASDARHARGLKDWGYRTAVEFAGQRGSGQRKRALVESYRTDWGHQASRDGLALALWPDLRDEVPGITKRCEEFGCGAQAYSRVREEVMRQAIDLITGFSMDMEQCRENRFSRDFIGRWEAASGREWSATAN